MRALTATAIVGSDHTLVLQLPQDIDPGPHQVVVVLQEQGKEPPRRAFMADWPAPYNTGLVDPNMTFRREDLYGDDGR